MNPVTRDFRPKEPLEMVSDLRETFLITRRFLVQQLCKLVATKMVEVGWKEVGDH